MKKSINPDEAMKQVYAIAKEYEIKDPAGKLYLGQLLEALCRLREAQKIVARDGAVVKDRWGQLKQHPATLVERDARMAIFKALAALRLDLEPLRDKAGRPPGR